jgi:hypothetical protein
MASDDLYNRIFGIVPASSKKRSRMTLAEMLATPPAPTATPDFYSALSAMLGTPPPAPPATPLSRLIRSSLPQPPSSTPVGIRFHDSYFSEPTPMAFASMPSLPGLYAILVMDFDSNPRPYRPLYFGKAVDLSSRVGTSHEKYGEWNRAAGGSTLYAAYHLMPGTTDAHRANVEESLIRHYKPVCNKTYTRLSDLLGY